MVFATDSENTHLYWWYAYDKKKITAGYPRGASAETATVPLKRKCVFQSTA